MYKSLRAQYLQLTKPERPPLVVAYGAGVDSTAMLIGMQIYGIRPDKILFADTGSEKPETYGYIKIMQRWLAHVGFPPIEIVKYRPRKATYSTLYENCITNKTLPSLAFGYKKCSLKFKRQPQDQHCNHWEPAQIAWAHGLKVIKVIGYDNGPADSKRAHHIGNDKKYEYLYPLRLWGWDRDICKAVIRAAGLPVPIKSACFFCPASKPEEILWLIQHHPELIENILTMERIAAPGLKVIEGLWRSSTKKRPGDMTTFIQQQRVHLSVLKEDTMPNPDFVFCQLRPEHLEQFTPVTPLPIEKQKRVRKTATKATKGECHAQCN